MGINYGTRVPDWVLTAEDLEEYHKPKKNDPMISIIRSIVTIIEIGVAFIPGIDVVVETGVGLAGGLINELLDYSTGHASVANTFINFASPLIAGGATYKINQNLVRKTLEGAESIEEATQALLKSGLREDEVAGALLSSGIINSIEELNNYQRVANILRNYEITSTIAGRKGTYILRKEVEKSIPGITKKEITNALYKMRKEAKNLLTYANNFEESFKIQKRILRTIGFNEKEVVEFLRKINSSNLTPKQKYSATLGFIRDTNVLTKDRTKYKTFIKALNKGEIALNEAYQIPLARQFNKLANKNFPETALKLSGEDVNKSKNKLIKALKDPGSVQFNDYILQPTQALFDANDAGRAPVEALYKILKRSFSKIPKVAKAAESVEDLFVKTGGTLVDSDWMIGYKKITDFPGVANLTQISYGKDTGNIKEVYVWATDHQLVSYRKDPGHYYLNHWAFSRGGKSLSLEGAFSKPFGKANIKMMSGVLTFIPNGALRNIFSLVSNIVENVYDMADGAWTKEWTKKFKNSFMRAGLNRSIRFGTRIIIGSQASKYLGKEMGNMIGRELQRIGTNVLAPLIRTHIINMERKRLGKKTLKSPLRRNNLINIGLKGVISNGRRALRKRRGQSSVILNHFTVQRKLQIINRAPNTFTPGRKYKGIRIK